MRWALPSAFVADAMGAACELYVIFPSQAEFVLSTRLDVVHVVNSAVPAVTADRMSSQRVVEITP